MSTKTDALMHTFHPKYYPFVNIKRARGKGQPYIVLQMPDQINRFSILFV